MAFNRERALAAAAKFSARGQHDRAAREYAAIVEADPSDLRSWVMLADCLVRAGDNAGAIDRFNRIAEFYAQAGEPTKAIAVYRQILNLDANRLDVHLKVGALLHEIGRTPDAVATYEFVAQSYFQGGQVADGLEAFRMVADLEPTAVAKRLRVAELYSREGRKAEAVEHFKLAARQLHAGRRYDDYVRVAERLLFHKEDDLEVLRNLAEIYLLMQKEARRALLKLNALLRLAPTDPGGLELLAETFVALGKQDKAVSVAVELAKEQRKHEVEGKERAARVLRKALGWNPDKPAELRKALGEIEAELEVLKAGEPEVLIDVAEAEPDELAAEEDDLDLDVDIDEGGADDQEDEVGDDGYDKDLSDEEKILREAQVYVQYRMFEHALSHLGGVLGPDPGNVVALELKVRCLEGLGRVREAADAHLAITQRVGEADPERAHAHLAAALKLAPTHPRAMMLASSLEAFGRVPERAEALPAAPQADAPATTRRPARPQPSADKSPPPRRVTGAGVPPAPPEKTPPPRRVTGAGVPPEAPRRENSPLPGPLPRREVTPPPRRLETTPPPAPPPRGDEADGERPTSTDDSGLLRFNAPKKMPPLPPGRGAGRGAKEGGVTPPAGRGEGRERGRSGTPAGRERGGDGDASEGEPEPSTAGDDAGRGEDEGGDAGVQVSESMLVHDAGADAATEATASTESEASEGPEPEEDAPRLRSGRLPSRELDRGLPTRRSSRRREARRRERSTPRGLPPVRAASGAHRASEASSEGQDPSDMSQETEEQSARARAEAADAVAELGPDGAAEAAPLAEPGEDAAGGEGDALAALTEVSDAPVEAAASDEAAVESAGGDPAPSDAGPEPEAPSADAAVASEGPGDADGSAEIDLEHRSEGSGAVEAEDAGPAAANIEPEAETSASSEVEDAIEPEAPAAADDSRADSGIGAEVDPAAAADAEVGATEDEAVVTDEDATGRDDETETEAESVEASGLDVEATATTEIAAEGEAIASPASDARAGEAAAELLSAGASTDVEESAPGAESAGEADEAEAPVSVEDATIAEATEEATIAEASPAEVTAEATSAEVTEEATPAEATPAEARVESDIEAPAHEAPSTGESAPTPEAAREAGEDEDEDAGEEEIEELDDVEVLDDEVELLDEGGDEAAPAAGAPPPLPTAPPPAPEPEPAEPVAAEAPEHDAREPPAATEAEAPEHDAAAEPPAATEAEAPEHDAAAEPPAAPEAEAPEHDASEPLAALEADAPESEAAEPPTEAATEVATEESAALDALDTPEGDDAPASASSSFVSLEDLAEAEEEATPAAAGPEIEWPDIADAVEELRFFLAQGFDDEAHVSFLDLQGRYPGHPALAEFAARFARLGDSTASAPVVLESEPELAAADSAPALSFAENDEEDDFLSSIFSDEPAPEKAKKADPPRARADLGDEGADARTLFDLGTAYREMGLIDDALQQFRGAARDPQWKARSLVMMASLHLHRGEIPEAITDLEEAVAAAVSDVERSEAHYELGVIYQVMGEHEKAIAALSEVKAGYRDRDERLAELKG